MQSIREATLSRRLRFGDYVERRKRIFVAIYHAAASIDWLCYNLVALRWTVVHE